MYAIIKCWSCGKTGMTDVPKDAMIDAITFITAVQNCSGWKAVIDTAHSRSLAFCSQECMKKQTTKSGQIRLKPKKDKT